MFFSIFQFSDRFFFLELMCQFFKILFSQKFFFLEKILNFMILLIFKIVFFSKRHTTTHTTHDYTFMLKLKIEQSNEND